MSTTDDSIEFTMEGMSSSNLKILQALADIYSPKDKGVSLLDAIINIKLQVEFNKATLRKENVASTVVELVNKKP